MCGQAGFISLPGLTQEQKELRGRVITSLLIGMETRGTDSTGIGVFDGQLKVSKKTTVARKFVQRRKYKDFIMGETNILIGHTRKASVGVVNYENSHPFLSGSVMGAHNGHFTNFRMFDPHAGVDSKVIFDELNKRSNNYKELFSEMRGEFSIVWTDGGETIHMVRDGRPLFIALSKQLQTLFWCSVEEMLYMSITMATEDFSLKTFELDESYVYTVDKDLYTTKEKVEFKTFETYLPKKVPSANSDAPKSLWLPKKGETSLEQQEIAERITQELRDEFEFPKPVYSIECEFCAQPIDFERDEYFYDTNNHVHVHNECADENDYMAYLGFKGIVDERAN